MWRSSGPSWAWAATWAWDWWPRGVETENQLAVIRSLGCHRAQGFLFSKPLPAKDMEAYLNARWGLSPESD